MIVLDNIPVRIVQVFIHQDVVIIITFLENGITKRITGILQDQMQFQRALAKIRSRSLKESLGKK